MQRFEPVVIAAVPVAVAAVAAENLDFVVSVAVATPQRTPRGQPLVVLEFGPGLWIGAVVADQKHLVGFAEETDSMQLDMIVAVVAAEKVVGAAEKMAFAVGVAIEQAVVGVDPAVPIPPAAAA